MARRSATNGETAVDEARDDWVRRLRKTPVDRILCQVTDPQTARDFWNLVQEVLERDGLRRAVSA
jgi:hypothetical protein